jgi:CheY-like chemotaxis protein
MPNRLKSTPNQAKRRGKPLVLIVEDVDWYRRALIRSIQTRCSVDALEADSGLAALTILAERAHEIDAIVADNQLPDGVDRGMFVLEVCSTKYPHIRRIMLTAWADSHLVEYAARLPRPYDVLDKSLDDWLIAAAICRLAHGIE